MHLSHAIFLFFAAIIAGTLNSIAGGGSFVSFPAMLFTGMPPVEANATNTVALWPGLAAGTLAYVKLLNAPRRLLAPLLLASIAGGVAGAVLLIKTPQHTFMHLVPWLLLGGTLLFAFGHRIRAMAGHSAASDDLLHASWRAITVASLLQLAVGIYGGYFGAGIGFVMLGMFTALGMPDLHSMNAFRTLLAAVINAAAVVMFIAAGAVLWLQCLTMMAGALLGGWFGARYAQKADPKKLRLLVICVGIVLSVYFFVRIYMTEV